MYYNPAEENPSLGCFMKSEIKGTTKQAALRQTGAIVQTFKNAIRMPSYEEFDFGNGRSF